MFRNRRWLAALLIVAAWGLRILLPDISFWIWEQFWPKEETQQIVDVFSQWLPSDQPQGNANAIASPGQD